MKQIFTAVAFVMAFNSIIAQADSTSVSEIMSNVVGEWDGYMEFSNSEDGKQTASVPAKCTTTWDGKVWKFEVQYDEGEGLVTGATGEIKMNDDSKTIVYMGDVWNVVEVNERGDSASIVLEITAKVKRKLVTTRHTIFVTSATFQIVETYKEEGQPAFIFNVKHAFRRQKSK